MKSRRPRLSSGVACLVLALVSSPPARTCVVELAPSKDNTLYEPEIKADQLSNGKGQYLFAGNNGLGRSRRALVHFELDRVLPPDAVIRQVWLTLNMSRTNVDSGPEPIALWRVLRDWGEGESVAVGGEGAGGVPQTGDATWMHTFFPNSNWISPGGDFEPFVESARLTVDGAGFHRWGSTPTMVADVNAWRNNPTQNFGWILVGNESVPVTAKRFDSSNHEDPAARPRLTIEFGLPGDAPGSVPNGASVAGTPLRLDKVGGDVALSWGHSCFSTDEDYVVYEGPLEGDFSVHGARACSTGGATSHSFTPAPGSSYYLVVPRGPDREGSYGTRSDGSQRVTGSGCKLLQEFDTCS